MDNVLRPEVRGQDHYYKTVLSDILDLFSGESDLSGVYIVLKAQLRGMGKLSGEMEVTQNCIGNRLKMSLL